MAEQVQKEYKFCEAPELIQRLLAFRAIADRYENNGRFQDNASEEYQDLIKASTELHDYMVVANVVKLVEHYEAKLLKANAESGQFALMKEAMRQVLAEQSKFPHGGGPL